MRNEFKLHQLHVDKTSYTPIAVVKEEDNVTLNLELFKDNIPLSLTGQTITLSALRPDKIIVEQTDGFVTSNNRLTIKLKNNIIAQNGMVYLELTLTDSAGSMTTLDFYLKVNRKILGHESIAGSDNIASLEKIKQEFNRIIEEASRNEAYRQTKEQERQAYVESEVKPIVRNEAERQAKELERQDYIENTVKPQVKKIDQFVSQVTEIENNVECIKHINLISKKNVIFGKYLNQDIGVSTINSFSNNNDYVTSPIIDVATNEKIYYFVTGYSVALFYSADGVLRNKVDLKPNSMNEITVPTVEGHNITSFRTFCDDISLSKFYISKIKKDKYYNYDSVSIEGLIPNDLAIGKIKEITNEKINSIEFSKKFERITSLTSKPGVMISDGNITGTEDSDLTHFEISVKAGDTFAISGNYGWAYIGFVLKDSNNNIVTKYPNTTDTSNKYTNELLNCSVDGILYVNNVYSIIANISKSTSIIPEKDWLFQKSIYFDGDSITYGAGGKSFADQIGDTHLMEYINKGVSGTTLAIQEGKTNSILERVKKISRTYDFIVIEGGYNDYFLKLPLGEITSDYDSILDEKTVIGATESICKHIKINFDDSNFLFVLGHRASEVGKIDNTFDDYWNAIESALIKWSVNYIDLRKKGGLVAYNQTWLTKYFGVGESMGTHPNELGYKRFYVPYIESELVKMISE